MDYPTGIRPDGAGLRIRIFRSGRLVFSETIQGNPSSKALIARAKRRRDAVKQSLDLGEPIERDTGPAALFSDAAQGWLNSRQCDDDTLRAYRNILQRYWMPLYGNDPVSHITRPSIEQALASFGVKIKTQKNCLGPLRMVLAHAGVHPNPATDMDWNKKRVKTERHKVERFTPDERSRVIAALDKAHDRAVTLQSTHKSQKHRAAVHWTGEARVFYALLFATGLRPGEALALRWQDYDGEQIFVSATHTRNKRKESTKTGVDRRVYVPSWVRPRLDAHPTRFAKGPIFVSARGLPLTDTKRITPIWRQALADCHLPDRDPYACRHTRAAELLSTSVNHAEAAAQLGHNVAMFTWLYSEWIEEYARRRDFSHLEGVKSDESATRRNRMAGK